MSNELPPFDETDRAEAERMDGPTARRARWTEQDEEMMQAHLERWEREHGPMFPDIEAPF